MRNPKSAREMLVGKSLIGFAPRDARLPQAMVGKGPSEARAPRAMVGRPPVEVKRSARDRLANTAPWSAFSPLSSAPRAPWLARFPSKSWPESHDRTQAD